MKKQSKAKKQDTPQAVVGSSAWLEERRRRATEALLQASALETAIGHLKSLLRAKNKEGKRLWREYDAARSSNVRMSRREP